MKKYCEILAKSSLLGHEVEQEKRQVEFISIDKTTDSSKNNPVGEINLTLNILDGDNENSSCRGGKFQQLEVGNEISESSHDIQNGQNGVTLTVSSSSGMSISHSTAPQSVICRNISTNTLSEEFSSPNKEEVNDLKVCEGMKAETSQPVDSLHLVTDYLSKITLSSSPKQRKGKKRKADLVKCNSWSEDTERYGDGVSPSSLEQASCTVSTQALMSTECLNNTVISLDKLSFTHKEIHCGKEFGEKSTNSPSSAETITKCILGTGKIDDSPSYPNSEASENLLNVLEVTTDNAYLYENDAAMHMNTENGYEPGNLLKNELAVCCHSDDRKEYDRGMDVNSYLPQSKMETGAQVLERNDSEDFGDSPSSCSTISALKSNDVVKDQNTCVSNLQEIVCQLGNLRVLGEEDFTSESAFHHSVSVTGNHLCSIKNTIVQDTTAGLDSGTLRKDRTLESCETECHERSEVQPACVSNTSFHSVLSSLQELTDTASTSCDQGTGPLRTSSPNNSFHSDDEDVLSIYASSWTELDTDEEQENNISEQKKSDQQDATNICLKMHVKRIKCEQEFTPEISDQNYVTRVPGQEFSERKLDVVDGKSFFELRCDQDVQCLVGSRKYSRKDGVSQSLCRETKTPDKLDFGDSSRQNICFSERSRDSVVLLGNSVENCVQKPILDGKGNDVEADGDSKSAISSHHRENNIELSRGFTFFGKIKKTENYMSLLNNLQEHNLTENVEYQEEAKRLKRGKEVKEKCVHVDEEIYPKGNKLFDKDFLLPDPEPQIASYLQSQKKVSKLAPKLPVSSKYHPYHHEMSLELENYTSLLILHYATHQQECQAWKLLYTHTRNSQYAPFLMVSLLTPLARYCLELDKQPSFEVPSYLASPLVVAKVHALCETHQGYDAFKLLQSCVINVTSHYVEILVGTFVRYCESRPETMATSPWEKVLLWKYEEPESSSEELKDILDIGWLKVFMEERNVGRVCDAYSHLCKGISAPSRIFTYFTFSVITFLNEIGERKSSFWVLKEVQRLKANDAAIFIALVPTDKESAMLVLPELAELGQLVCELRVQLPSCTWDLLSSLMMTFGYITLGIDLLICAMQINSFEPNIKVLEKLLHECSRGDPVLLLPVSNLVCALSAEYLTNLRPLLHYLVTLLACGPLSAQQAKYNIIHHCKAHGINLQTQGGVYDSIPGNQIVSQFGVHDAENSVAEFSSVSENSVNQIVGVSEKRNSGSQFIQSLEKRNLSIGGVDHNEQLLDVSLCCEKKLNMQTKTLSEYLDAFIGDNTSIPHFPSSQYNLIENINVRSFGSPCLEMHCKDNVVSADLGYQDQFVSSATYGYQDHQLSSLEPVYQNKYLSLCDSGSGYQNQRSTDLQEESFLSAWSQSCPAEYGYQRRGNQCDYYLEHKREYGQTDRNGEYIEERQECTQPHDSQSSINSHTNYVQSMLDSQMYKGLPRQGSLLSEVTSAHFSVYPESLGSASHFHDNTSEKGNALSVVLGHNSIKNLPPNHTQSQLYSSRKLARSFVPQEKALYGSANDIKHRNMNHSKSYVNNGPAKLRKKCLPLSSVKQKQESCPAYQPYIVKQGSNNPKIFCTKAKTDHINRIRSQRKINSKHQERSDSNRGRKMVKRNKINESLPSFIYGGDEHFSMREGKLTQLTENIGEHQSLRCFLAETTQHSGMQRKSYRNSSKITQSTISPVQELANSSPLDYIIVDVEGCTFNEKYLRTINSEITLPRRKISLNKGRTLQQQQNSRSTYHKKVTRSRVLGVSHPNKKYGLKFRDFTSGNIILRQAQDSNSRTTNKISQLTGDVGDGRSITMPYEGHEELATVTGRHNPTDVAFQRTAALRKFNDLWESDKETAYLKEVKGIMGSNAHYTGRERRRGMNVTRKVKRIRFRPWKASMRPLLRQYFHI